MLIDILSQLWKQKCQTGFQWQIISHMHCSVVYQRCAYCFNFARHTTNRWSLRQMLGLCKGTLKGWLQLFKESTFGCWCLFVSHSSFKFKHFWYTMILIWILCVIWVIFLSHGEYPVSYKVVEILIIISLQNLFTILKPKVQFYQPCLMDVNYLRFNQFTSCLVKEMSGISFLSDHHT